MQSIKARLAAGDTCIGSWLSLGSLETAEMMARAGFDWLAIDMEHTGIGARELVDLIRVVDMAGVAPLVRVGENHPLLIKRALDAGAQGIIVPMVGSRAEAERAVQYASYPPRGVRGVGLYRAQDYGLGFAQYRDWINENTLVAIQIEHRDAIDELPDMLAVEGVDAFFIGPYDLSGSFGKPGDFENPEVADALARIRAVVKTGVKPASGTHVVDPDTDKLKAALAEGHRFVAFSSDLLVLSHALAGHSASLGLERRFNALWRDKKPENT
jgi:2-dehydro-3-deoxyglucarate aldolase